MEFDSQHGERNSDFYIYINIFLTELEEEESKIARWHRKMAKPLKKNSYQVKKESDMASEMAILQQCLRIRSQQRYSEVSDDEISSQPGHPSGSTDSRRQKIVSVSRKWICTK